jgi:hypothetical protein
MDRTETEMLPSFQELRAACILVAMKRASSADNAARQQSTISIK